MTRDGRCGRLLTHTSYTTPRDTTSADDARVPSPARKAAVATQNPPRLRLGLVAMATPPPSHGRHQPPKKNSRKRNC